MIGGERWAWLLYGRCLLAAVLVLAGCRPDPGAEESPPERRTLALLRALAANAEARPVLLSELGFYDEGARLLPGFLAFEPAFPLYSDGAEKRRWLRLPRSGRIDAGSGEHWQFPVGTLLVKEFAHAGRKLETRVVARFGTGADDFFLGAFVWNEDESDARFVPQGERDVRGSDHDVPSVRACWSCHGGEPSRVLGFSSVQQPAAATSLFGGARPRVARVPGNESERAALGYLHANCGHCHNPRGSARPDTDLDLRLSGFERAVADTGAYRTAVGRSTRSFSAPRAPGLRVAPGAPGESALHYRMLSTAPDTRMPPLGTEVVDARGTELVRRWIQGLGDAQRLTVKTP